MKEMIHVFEKFALVIAMLFSLNIFAANVTIYAELPSSKNDAVSLDSNGNLYVSHAGPWNGGLTGTQVYKIDQNGTASTARDGLSGPLGSAFDSNGNMYVSNYNTGDLTRFAGEQSDIEFAQLSSGGGIVIDSHDNIFVSSYFGNTVYRIDLQGVVEVWVTGGGLNGPVGLALDNDENLYVANYNDGKIFKIGNQGNATKIANIPEGHDAFIGYITYADKAIYATGFDANKIYEVSLTGVVKQLAGTEAIDFKNPNGIAASADGKFLYVSEYESKKLYQIDLSVSSSGGSSGSGSSNTSSGATDGGSGGGTLSILLVFLSIISVARKIRMKK